MHADVRKCLRLRCSLCPEAPFPFSPCGHGTRLSFLRAVRTTFRSEVIGGAERFQRRPLYQAKFSLANIRQGWRVRKRFRIFVIAAPTTRQRQEAGRSCGAKRSSVRMGRASRDGGHVPKTPRCKLCPMMEADILNPVLQELYVRSLDFPRPFRARNCPIIILLGKPTLKSGPGWKLTRTH